ncbi:hypothetical protein OG749_05310 [Streptomyces nojiriensis]|uniref:hypothetical protein n=1 Tax=Streptomyces nojiriensis TaxID=66374 RepID=UPI002E19EB19
MGRVGGGSDEQSTDAQPFAHREATHHVKGVVGGWHELTPVAGARLSIAQQEAREAADLFGMLK